jgi:hypothetical protein
MHLNTPTCPCGNYDHAHAARCNDVSTIFFCASNGGRLWDAVRDIGTARRVARVRPTQAVAAVPIDTTGAAGTPLLWRRVRISDRQMPASACQSSRRPYTRHSGRWLLGPSALAECREQCHCGRELIRRLACQGGQRLKQVDWQLWHCAASASRRRRRQEQRRSAVRSATARWHGAPTTFHECRISSSIPHSTTTLAAAAP